MKRFYFIAAILFISSTLVFPQKNIKSDFNGDINPVKVRVEKGKTLFDVVNPGTFLRNTVTDVNPGIDPEGDYITGEAFSTDGNKLFVVNGQTNNISVFNFETMQVEHLIDGMEGYLAGIGVTDNYIVVGSLSGNIYIIDLSNYSVVKEFSFDDGSQPVVVKISPDGNYAYVAADVTDKLFKIDLQTLELVNTFPDFPVQLMSYTYTVTGGRISFEFSSFSITHDGNYLVYGNYDDSVFYMNTVTGNIDHSFDITSCLTVGLSGDGAKTVALSYNYNTQELKIYRIDNNTFQIDGEVDMPGYQLMTQGVAVNEDGTKAYIGIDNNRSALVRFETSDFSVYGTNYTPFWLGTSPDHHYAVHGQYRFSIFDFQSESFVGNSWGHSQSLGAVSPVGFKVAGCSPVRYEGIYFYDCTDPSDINYKGKNLTGYPPEGDTPYRIAISPDGTKAVSVNNISNNISIIDMQSYSVDTILDMGEDSWDVAISPDSHWAVVGGYDSNTIKIIDLTTNTLVKEVTTAQRPMMVQISPDNQYAYIGNLKSNSVSIVKLDGENSFLVKTIQVGVIGISFYAKGVKSGVKISPTGQYLLVAASFNDKVQVIDTQLKEVVANLPVGTFPLQIAFNTTGDTAVVTNLNSDNFSVIHVAGYSSEVLGTYPCYGETPLRVAYNPVTRKFGITLADSKKVINIDSQNGNITSVDNYASYGYPVQIRYDDLGKPVVLVLNNDNNYLIKDLDEVVEMPASPTFFDFCNATNTAVVSMPGPDHITVVEFDVNTQPPIADFTADVTNIHIGDMVHFTDISENEPTAWEWIFEGGIPATSNEQNPVVKYDSTGSFDVTLTASNQFGSDTKTVENYIVVDTILSVNDIAGDSFVLKAYPNPVKDFLNIGLNESNGKTDKVSVSVFDFSGKLLMSRKINKNNTRIDLRFLKKGGYLLKVSGKNNSKVFKLIKN